MAKKSSKQQAAQKTEQYCRDCELAYDFHELDYHGNPFLCKCPFEEWSQFLNHPNYCRHFKKKQRITV